jgi:hypothetical protein
LWIRGNCPRTNRPEKAKFVPGLKTGVRAAASQRTASGKFNRVAFATIGGSEVPKYAKLTWVQRDSLHEKVPGCYPNPVRFATNVSR